MCFEEGQWSVVSCSWLVAPRRAPRNGRRTTDNGRRRGFSLIEFTVVLALIGLLAGIVTISVRPMLTRGKQNAARAEIANIRQALEQFYSLYGRYPTNDEGLAVLRKPSDRTDGPLLTQDPKDPWGRQYQYNAPGRTEPYEVISFGADGREGGSAGDKDIVSWDLKEGAGKGNT
jgi:general secretion pathway protein G